jgi:hypothetical protein
MPIGLEAIIDGWSRSTVNEVITCLWIIAALIAFRSDFEALGWVIVVKVVVNTVRVVCYMAMDIKSELANYIGKSKPHS